MEPLIFAIGDKTPKIHETAFIAPGAVVCGDVEVHENASVWYGCVLRGDTNKIVVGKGSNVQDGTIIHVDDPQWGGLPTLIGENVLIGHKCMLHGAKIEDGGFVGMGATMLDGSVVKPAECLPQAHFFPLKKPSLPVKCGRGCPPKSSATCAKAKIQWQRSALATM